MAGSAESDSVGGSKAGKKLRNPSAESGLCQIKIEDNVTQGRSIVKRGFGLSIILLALLDNVS